MAEGFELQASARERVGKGAARALRREGMIPAVIYGNKEAPLPIAIPLKETSHRLHAGGFLTNIWTIDVDGKQVRVLARDYQLEPVKDFLVHVDFLRVTRSTRVAVDVPVTFVNEDQSPGLIRGGVLNVVRHTIELECPADAIPNSIEVDVAGLDINDSAHISGVTLPAGIEPTIRDRDFAIATISAPVEEIVEEPEEGGVLGAEEAGALEGTEVTEVDENAAEDPAGEGENE